MLDELKLRYEQYLAYTVALSERASPMDGLLGFGHSPKDDSGHTVFFEDVGKWAEAFLAADPSEKEVGEAVNYILRAADCYQDNGLAYWFLYAAQGHTIPMIPKMSPEERRSLFAWYDRHYPKVTRMPVQKEIARLLKR